MKYVAETAVLLFALIAVVPVDARIRHSPEPSEAEKARREEQSLRETVLKINHKCEPSSISTKIWLKTLNDYQTKYFWLGQKYAVERSYKEQIDTDRMIQISNQADARIAAIERQRDEANLAIMGIKPQRFPEFEKASAEVDRELNKLRMDLSNSNYQWFVKCSRYADERSR